MSCACTTYPTPVFTMYTLSCNQQEILSVITALEGPMEGAPLGLTTDSSCRITDPFRTFMSEYYTCETAPAKDMKERWRCQDSNPGPLSIYLSNAVIKLKILH